MDKEKTTINFQAALKVFLANLKTEDCNCTYCQFGEIVSEETLINLLAIQGSQPKFTKLILTLVSHHLTSELLGIAGNFLTLGLASGYEIKEMELTEENNEINKRTVN